MMRLLKPPEYYMRKYGTCFYGLNRALRHTIRSIDDHLRRPLADACAEIDVYAHTWDVTDIVDTAAAGGEREAVAIGGADEMRRLLEPRGLRSMEVGDQAAFDRAANGSYYEALDRRYAGPNFRNLLRQLESLRRADALRVAGGPHDAVVYARPDLLFLDDANVTRLLNLPEGILLSPYWHRWSGLNDRVAAAAPATASLVARRVELARAYEGRAGTPFVLRKRTAPHAARIKSDGGRGAQVRGDDVFAGGVVPEVGREAPPLDRGGAPHARAARPRDGTSGGQRPVPRVPALPSGNASG